VSSSLSVATFQAKTYTVSTPVFEGPLDLLLQLIERAELDITRLALAQVTDQYLEHLRALQERVPDEVSAFLVIAAKLLQIKSEALLPAPPARAPGEEDPGEALAMQLLAYKRYREIAGLLSEREAAGLRTYLRLAPPPKVEGAVDLTGLGLPDLLAAARAALLKDDLRPSLSSVVAPPRVTIREKIALVARTLRQRGRTTFANLLKSRRSRLDVVVTFLAMLELVKRHLVQVRQERLFGEIELEAAETWDENNEFELEFGE
jgi:segregation and condensation protein A